MSLKIKIFKGETKEEVEEKQKDWFNFNITPRLESSEEGYDENGCFVKTVHYSIHDMNVWFLGYS